MVRYPSWDERGCPNCGQTTEEDDILYRCPTCGTEGFGDCCFPAGSNTECLDCETSEEDSDDFDEDEDNEGD